jgi:FHA domain/Protein of unknown function (DUF3662)
MAEDNKPDAKRATPPSGKLTPDKLIQGVLSKIGSTFDGLFGRDARASSLATSEIAARTRRMLDSQLRDMGENGRFVPHIIKVKVEWGKFSTESKDALLTLENELMAAVIDHINDSRYLTYGQLQISVTPDYFVEGIHIITSFGEKENENDEVDLSVTMPNINVKELLSEIKKSATGEETVFAKFALHGMEKEIRLRFEPGERLNVGRTRENDLALEDQSVSKLHAALSFNSAGQLVAADTGSTNGTFINKERLAYGKAFPIGEHDMVTFGTVDVFFRHIAKAPEPQEVAAEPVEEEKGPITIKIENG